MWILSSQFGTTESAPTCDRLLRTGNTYKLSRAEGSALRIASKRVSKQHGHFTVAKFSKNDVTDASKRPALTFTNTKGKDCYVTRAGGPFTINDGATGELQDGDEISIFKDGILSVRWKPVCCFQESPAKADALKVCASLGIHLVNKQSPGVTHHLTSECDATLVQAISLVSGCHFVKPEWLKELLGVDNTSPANLPIEWSKPSLPSPGKFQPEFTATLAEDCKKAELWQPGEERHAMLARHTFLCAGEKAQVAKSLRLLLERGGGDVSAFDINTGAETWRQTLKRNMAKTDQTLILVADVDACKAALGKGWKAIMDVTNEFELSFSSTEDIVHAIISRDRTLLRPASSPLPTRVPNSFPEEVEGAEQSPEPEPVRPKRQLVRRVTRASSQDPEPATDMPPPPRKALTRRAGDAQIITGLDDPSFVLRNMDSESSKQPSAQAPPAAEDDLDAPRPRRKQLKRRVGVAADPNDPVAMLLQQGAAGLLAGRVGSSTGPAADLEDEPPLKKFKALFEGSMQQDGTQSLIPDDDEDFITSQLNSQSQTQTQSGATGRRRNAILRAVPEEEEESQSQAVTAAASRKRKERSFDGDDVEMADVEAALATQGSMPAAKKRAGAGVVAPVQRVPSAVTQPTTTTAQKAAGPSGTTVKLGKNAADAATAGAAPGKPDQDTAFLKAVASTKRGKRAEDDFDRDFNNLKIPKAELQADEEENRPAWELLEDFDDGAVTGNFMVIEELEVFKSRNGDAAETGNSRRGAPADARWEGKINFKKFRRSNSSIPKERVTVYLNDARPDARDESNFWNDDLEVKPPPDSPDLDDFGPTLPPTQKAAAKKGATQKATTQKKESQSQSRKLLTIDDSESDEPRPPPPAQTRKRSKPPSVAEPPAKRSRTTRASSRAPESSKAAPLFLDDSDEGGGSRSAPRGATQDDDDFEMGDETQTLKTQPARKSQRATAKKAIVVDNDSDDEAVFVGFRRR
ncbi:CDC73-C domain-containing protein [Mycena chlorophos]|uniref:CDC73-C domain-containing protein n=1 Tax=Mycena chlorophos TaxID=658473 RepID=A0A8H6SHB0_MYCCL|nr:CDC73-C domain-containing protein [Mycena chlorophos]